MIIIAAITICTLGVVPADKCESRVANAVLFPAACARAGRCVNGEPYVYDDTHAPPYMCYIDAVNWVLSQANSQHRLGHKEFFSVHCGPQEKILDRYGTI